MQLSFSQFDTTLKKLGLSEIFCNNFQLKQLEKK